MHVFSFFFFNRLYCNLEPVRAELTYINLLIIEPYVPAKSISFLRYREFFFSFQLICKFGKEIFKQKFVNASTLILIYLLPAEIIKFYR